MGPGARVRELDVIPEPGELARRRNAEPLERRATRPVDVLVVGGRGLRGLAGKHALGQVVDLLEALATGDREDARAPEELERAFRRSPGPPGPSLARLLLDEVSRAERSLGANPRQHRRRELLGVLPHDLSPARRERPREAAAPVAEPPRRDERRV